MREESFQERRRLCLVTDSLVRNFESELSHLSRHPPHLPIPLTRRALLHGIGMELLTGTATHPTTPTLPALGGGLTPPPHGLAGPGYHTYPCHCCMA